MIKYINKQYKILLVFLFLMAICNTSYGQILDGNINVTSGQSYTYIVFVPIGTTITTNSWSTGSGGNITSSNLNSAVINWTGSGNSYVTALVRDSSRNISVLTLNVTIGSGVPSTPANPTVQSTIPGSVTLQRTGTPQSGETWYWQNSPTGTSIIHGSGSTKIVTSGSTYYIRAKNNSGWSTGTGSVSYTVPPVVPAYNFSDENYVHTLTPTIPTTDVLALNNNEKIENITYFDGLGRPKQNIAIRAGGDKLENNIIDWKHNWNLGSGSASFFNQNGATSENERIMGTDPYGDNSMLWECGNDSSNNADGGWNSTYFSVDKTVGYRYTVWVKRTGSQNGKTYHGTHNVNNLSGSANSNPYFFNGDTPNLDQWYLLVGIIHPYTYGTASSGISGVYDTNGNKVMSGTDYKWMSNTTTANFRSYLYYATNTSVRQYFYDPIVQRLDGTEASIQEIVDGHTGKDIITHIEYDAFGRQAKDYLPYATTNQGLFVTTAYTDTKSFYDTPKYEDTKNPYSQKFFESSPLNIVLEQTAPGEIWKIGTTIDSNGHSNGHSIKNKSKLVSTSDLVRHYEVSYNASNIPSLVDSGFLVIDINSLINKRPTLYKLIVKNENWVTSDANNNTTQTFKDYRGRTILNRTFESGVQHDTYYVYDNYGNLAYVLSPKSEPSYKPNSTEIAELCYQYRYDDKNRLIEKKIPGKGWEYIVYNNLDQPIMTQDANLDAQNKWLFTKYDEFGRVAYTGIINSNSSRSSLQTTVNTVNSQYVTKSTSSTSIAGTTVYYNNGAYPTSISELYTINYYDNYTFDKVSGNSETSYGVTPITNVKGLATGSKIRVLDTNNWITTVSYYDEKSNPIYVYNYNSYLSTTDKVKSDFDFVGKVTETTTTHAKTSNSTITTYDYFDYDHVGRLLSQEQKVASHANEMIVQNQFDDLGQPQTKAVGGATSKTALQLVDYSYNIRGWLKEINDVENIGSDLFTFKINYTNEELNSGHSTPLYNGNITETIWKTANDISSNKTKGYAYKYDDINRLTYADYGVKTGTGSYNLSSGFDMSVTGYDKNGNITGLWRDDTTNGVKIDNLSYNYHESEKSNQLKSVNDSSGNNTDGFNNGANLTTEYTYDANGNLLTDLNKGITSITYNHLNLPKQVTIGSNNIQYFYDATGIKLKKIVSNGDNTLYAGNYIYNGAQGSETLKFYNHAEGYVAHDNGSFDYFYQYKDHLGNNRINYTDANNDGTVTSTEITEENNYYPFGLKHKGYNNVITSTNSALKYKYNGKELEEALGLNMYEYGARQYDAALGRFVVIDPMAEDYFEFSSYSYCAGNPVACRDENGEWINFVIGAVVGAVIDAAVQGVEIALDDSKTADDFSWKSVGISAAAGAVGVGIASKLKKVGTIGKILIESATDAAASTGTQLVRDGEVDVTDVIVDVIGGQTAGKIVGDAVDSKFLKSNSGKKLQENVNQQKNAKRGKSNTISKSKANVDGAESNLNGAAAARSTGASTAASGVTSTTVNEIKKTQDEN